MPEEVGPVLLLKEVVPESEAHGEEGMGQNIAEPGRTLPHAAVGGCNLELIAGVMYLNDA